jgi:hypothetical protein
VGLRFLRIYVYRFESGGNVSLAVTQRSTPADNSAARYIPLQEVFTASRVIIHLDAKLISRLGRHAFNSQVQRFLELPYRMARNCRKLDVSIIV